MSDKTTINKDNKLSEVVREIVITPEDVEGAADFWTHFKIDMPAELKSAFEAFKSNPTSVDAQDEVKLQLCKAVGYTNHAAFNDEMFKEIAQECRDITYDLEFDKSLRQNLTTE